MIWDNHCHDRMICQYTVVIAMPSRAWIRHARCWARAQSKCTFTTIDEWGRIDSWSWRRYTDATIERSCHGAFVLHGAAWFSFIPITTRKRIEAAYDPATLLVAWFQIVDFCSALLSWICMHAKSPWMSSYIYSSLYDEVLIVCNITY